MGAHRKVPSFYGKGKPEIHYLAGLVALLGGLFFLSGIFAPKNSLSDWLGCLVLPFLSFLLIFGAVTVAQEGTSIQREMRSWFGTSDKANTTIVNRREVANDPADVDYAYSYGQFMPSKYWYLTLQMIPSQVAIKPEETLVSVAINESQYKRYDGRTSVTIYYSTTDSFIFLLEDEV